MITTSRLSALAVLLLLWPARVAPAQEGPSAGARPLNVVLFLADDMTYHDLGSYGNRDVATPNLDGLAAEGMRFRYAFNSAPMCAPTRMSLYTGLHPVRNGAHPNHSRVYDHVRSLPHYFEPLGYRTALIGKRHEAPEALFPFEFLGGQHHDDGDGVDLDLDRVSAFMEESRDRPWFLVVASNQPHRPWNRGDAARYDPEALELPPYLVDTQETREGLARYYAEITYMDRQVGEVLEMLEATGQADETLVLFLSEHGSNFPHAKWTLYDTGVRSAAIVRWPGVVRPGAVSDAMIQYVDVLPTLLEAAGGSPAVHEFDGSSFLPVLTGARDDHRAYAYGVQTSRGIYAGPEAYGIRTVRDARYRLIWNLNWKERFQNTVTAGFKPYLSWVRAAEAGDAFARERTAHYERRPQFELYDLEADPYELHDLAESADHRAVLERLRAELEAWMHQQGDRGVATELEADERQ